MAGSNVMSVLENAVASILNGQSLSGAISLGGVRLFGLVMPAAWTAAVVTFQASFDNGATWVSMYDASGNELSVTVGASRYVALDPVYFAAVPMIRLRSGTAAAPVNQGQDSPISLVLRSI